MTEPTIIEHEFQRQAGPRRMYGCVTMKARMSAEFQVEISVQWPPAIERARYELAIRDGIVQALGEAGYEKPIGRFQIVGVRFSDDDEANVPFAYGEAARQAARDIVKEWQPA